MNQVCTKGMSLFQLDKHQATSFLSSNSLSDTISNVSQIWKVINECKRKCTRAEHSDRSNGAARVSVWNVLYCIIHSVNFETCTAVASRCRLHDVILPYLYYYCLNNSCNSEWKSDLDRNINWLGAVVVSNQQDFMIGFDSSFSHGTLS